MKLRTLLLDVSHEHPAMTEHQRWVVILSIAGGVILIATILGVRYIYLQSKYPPGKGYSYTFDHPHGTPLSNWDVLKEAEKRFTGDVVLHKRIIKREKVPEKYIYTVELYFKDSE